MQEAAVEATLAMEVADELPPSLQPEVGVDGVGEALLAETSVEDRNRLLHLRLLRAVLPQDLAQRRVDGDAEVLLRAGACGQVIDVAVLVFTGAVAIAVQLAVAEQELGHLGVAHRQRRLRRRRRRGRLDQRLRLGGRGLHHCPVGRGQEAHVGEEA